MKKKAFTYIEVAIAFSIFAIMLVYVMKLDSTANRTMRENRQKLQMLYVAQMEMEKHKNDGDLTPLMNYYTVTFNNITYYVKFDVDVYDDTESFGFSNPNINKGNGNNSLNIDVYEVSVIVKKNQADPDSDGVKIYNHLPLN